MNKQHEALRVGPARHGYGVFAEQPFGPEETVRQVTGEVIADPDYSTDYCMDLGAGLSLEPHSPLRFLNHSCEPNCELVLVEIEKEDGSEGIPEIWLETIRAIRPGEELTIDYAWPAEDGIECGCGSPGCRGWIGATSERSPLAPRGDTAGAGSHQPASRDAVEGGSPAGESLSNPA